MDNSSQVSRKYESDCQYLHCFFSGNGATNHQKVVEILKSRNLKELKLIRQVYGALYNQDLIHFLFDAQRNNPFAKVAYLRMSEPQERDAEIVRSALFGGSTVDLNTIIEILCTRASLELQSMKQGYHSRYKSDIGKDISLKISGSFKEILMAVLKSSCNNYGGKVDMSMAMCDAKTLYEAMESGKSVDQKTIICLMSQRTSGQLKAILAAYKKLYGHEFSKSLKRNKCGQFGMELRVVIRCTQYPEKYFAKQLRRTLKNGDTREVLIRAVITRAGIDIKDINNAFAAKTGSSLESLVRREFNCTSSRNNSSTDKANAMVAEFLIALLKH